MKRKCKIYLSQPAMNAIDLNFEFSIAFGFIVPVTLSRDNPRKKFEPIILEVTVT